MAYTLTYTSIDALTTKVTGFTGTPVDVIVPATADGGRAVVEIGQDVFTLCTTLESVVLPEGLLSIGGYAFDNASSLSFVSLPSTLTSIDAFGFSNCYSLRGIEAHGNAPTFGFNCTVNTPAVFYISNTSTGWDGVGVPLPSIVFETIDATTCKVLGFTGTPIDVVVPETYGGRDVVEIGAGAFASCSTITSIEMTSVITIGNYAFQSCDSLSSISMTESVTSIGEEGFAYCTALASITIPDTVTSIGDYCFTDCLSLSTVTLPASITSLGTSLFFGCPSLLSITIPASVVSIGVSCFENCDYLASITFLGNAPTFDAVCFDNGNGIGTPIPATAYILSSATGWPTPPGAVGDPAIPTGFIGLVITTSGILQDLSISIAGTQRGHWSMIKTHSDVITSPTVLTDLSGNDNHGTITDPVWQNNLTL